MPSNQHNKPFFFNPSLIYSLILHPFFYHAILYLSLTHFSPGRPSAMLWRCSPPRSSWGLSHSTSCPSNSGDESVGPPLTLTNLPLCPVKKHSKSSYPLHKQTRTKCVIHGNSWGEGWGGCPCSIFILLRQRPTRTNGMMYEKVFWVFFSPICCFYPNVNNFNPMLDSDKWMVVVIFRIKN